MLYIKVNVQRVIYKMNNLLWFGSGGIVAIYFLWRSYNNGAITVEDVLTSAMIVFFGVVSLLGLAVLQLFMHWDTVLIRKR